jgi:DNA sulfur modification protein DndD
MLLKRLKLNNFGTYAGCQEFNLSTSGHNNVILIGGKNGAGKSTILEAIRLCFHGQLSDRLLTTRERYERYLMGRIHRGASDILPAKSSSIEIEFAYGDHDGLRSYTALRSWERRSTGGISEIFELSCDGSPISDVDAIHWQDFIQELIPIGVSDLFFFDGEKVQLLAEDESDRLTLSEAVRNLLGTDVIEKLNADMSIYRSRTIQGVAEDANTPDLDVLSTSVDLSRCQLEAATKEATDASASVDALRIEVQAAEQSLQDHGGAYAKNRGRLEERKKQISIRVAALENSIRDRSQGLLAIALAPKLLRSTLEQLRGEQDLRFKCVLDDAMEKAARSTLTQLRKLSTKRGSNNILLGDYPEFEKILSIVKTAHKTREWDIPMIHDLSNAHEQQIQSWAVEALETVPKELKKTGEELETLYRERQRVERDLSRIPHDDVLLPLLNNLSELHKRLGELAVESIQKGAAVELSRVSLEKAEANYRQAVARLAATSVRRLSLDRAVRVQSVLTDFKQALTEKKVKQVEVELTTCFNKLSRKRLPRTITINPNTFQVTIRDDHDRAISKQELSAGEKQIYAISVLWALGIVSGRPLPIIIDTPLARLDRDHRALLGQLYFPNASHQVIILSTDTEIDSDFIPLLGDSIARSYELDFDSASQSTQVNEGYFGKVLAYEAH